MTTTPGPRTPTHEEALTILSQVTMAMTTLTPAESVAGVLAQHGVKLPQQPARKVLSAGPVDVVDDDAESELSAAEWKTGVERFLLTWGQAGNILRADGNEIAEEKLLELVSPLWAMTDLGDEHRPIPEHQLADRTESAEMLAAMLDGFADAMTNDQEDR